MAIFSNLGVTVTEQEVQAMVLEVDEDGSGTIDFEEFRAMVNHVRHCPRLPAVSPPFAALSLTRRVHRRWWTGLVRKVLLWRWRW